MKNNLYKIAILGGSLIVFQAFAFSEPQVAPPGVNVAAPLNVSNVSQVKDSALWLNTTFGVGSAAIPSLTVGSNVGIGIVNPLVKLHIQSNETWPTILALQNTNVDQSEGLSVWGIPDDPQRFAGFTYFNASYGTVEKRDSLLISTGVLATNGINIANTGSTPIKFGTGGTFVAQEKMRISGTGDVGIGTTNPTAKLDVAGSLKLGTAGTVFSAAGVCTVSPAFVLNATAVAKTCTGVPASTAVAVSCSPSGAFVGGAFAVMARANNTLNSITMQATGANTASLTYTCMWVRP